MPRPLFLSQGPSKLISGSDDDLQQFCSKYGPLPEALASSENLLKMQTLEPQSKSKELETLGGGPSNLFISPPDDSNAGWCVGTTDLHAVVRGQPWTRNWDIWYFFLVRPLTYQGVWLKYAPSPDLISSPIKWRDLPWWAPGTLLSCVFCEPSWSMVWGSSGAGLPTQHHQNEMLWLHYHLDFLMSLSLFSKNLELNYSWTWVELPQLSPVIWSTCQLSWDIERVALEVTRSQKWGMGLAPVGAGQQRQTSSNCQFHWGLAPTQIEMWGEKLGVSYKTCCYPLLSLKWIECLSREVATFKKKKLTAQQSLIYQEFGCHSGSFGLTHC